MIRKFFFALIIMSITGCADATIRYTLYNDTLYDICITKCNFALYEDSQYTYRSRGKVSVPRDVRIILPSKSYITLFGVKGPAYPDFFIVNNLYYYEFFPRVFVENLFEFIMDNTEIVLCIDSKFLLHTLGGSWNSHVNDYTQKMYTQTPIKVDSNYFIMDEWTKYITCDKKGDYILRKTPRDDKECEPSMVDIDREAINHFCRNKYVPGVTKYKKIGDSKITERDIIKKFLPNTKDKVSKK